MKKVNFYYKRIFYKISLILLIKPIEFSSVCERFSFCGQRLRAYQCGGGFGGRSIQTSASCT